MLAPLLTERPPLVHSKVFVFATFKAVCVKTQNLKLFNGQKPVDVWTFVTEEPQFKDKIKDYVQVHRAFSHFIPKQAIPCAL